MGRTPLNRKIENLEPEISQDNILHLPHVIIGQSLPEAFLPVLMGGLIQANLNGEKKNYSKNKEVPPLFK